MLDIRTGRGDNGQLELKRLKLSDNTHEAIIRGLAEELGWECSMSGAFDGESPPGDTEAWEDYLNMAIGQYRWERDGDVAIIQIEGGKITFTCTWFAQSGYNVFDFLLADPNLIELIKGKLK